jgi:hypothetical protein
VAKGKIPAITIDYFRFSLIWVETNLNLLGDPGAKNVPLGFLGSRDPYADAFDKIQAGQDPPGADLEAPWEERGQHFWSYYLENADLDAVKGQTVWHFQVPFMTSLPFTVTAPWFDGVIALNAYLYPHGFGVVMNARSEKTRSLTETVDCVLEIRKQKLDVKENAGNSEQLNALQLGTKCLGYLRDLALGANAPVGKPAVHAEPFSVFTVIKGTGATSDAAIKEKGEVHRALEGLASLSTDYKKAKLPSLDSEVKLELKATSPDGHLVYARKRGRSVWFPAAFMDQVKRRTLACYHRNQVLMSLQVESLCGLASATAEDIKAGKWQSLPVMHRACARLAAGSLGRLYGDYEKTYRSLSPRYYIRQNDLVAQIDKLRDQCGMPKLS